MGSRCFFFAWLLRKINHIAVSNKTKAPAPPTAIPAIEPPASKRGVAGDVTAAALVAAVVELVAEAMLEFDGIDAEEVVLLTNGS